MLISIETRISPTEDSDRVRQAIQYFFPDAAEGENREGGFVMTSKDIRPLLTRILEQKIRDAARGVLLKAVREDRIIFHLNKQAAHSGRVNFTDGNSPLGDLKVSFCIDEPEEWIHKKLGRPE